MELKYVFWIVMLFWLLFAIFFGYPRTAAESRVGYVSNNAIAFILFLILGWAEFGKPITG